MIDSKRWRSCLLIVFSVLCLLWLSPNQTAATNLYHEQLVFDSDGNLHMTTHDKKASGGVSYRTIGWTIKRFPGSVSSTQRVRIPLPQSSVTYPDPDNEDYLFVEFTCDGKEIFERIGEVSADWQLDLYQNGGVVYLDAVMTVVEHGKLLGSIDADGTLHGEVYVTETGIMNARAWTDPEALRTHFNKEVYVLPVPALLHPPTEEHYENEIVFAYGEDECRRNQTMLQSVPEDAPVFDVMQGIPTGEEVVALGALQKYFFSGVLVHSYGVVPVPVKLAVTYTYTTMTENGPASGSFTSQMTLYVQRPYSYYRIKTLDLFSLKGVRVENEALADGAVEVWDLYTPDIDLIRDQETYLIIPTFSGSVYGGDLSAGAVLSMEQLQAYAEAAAGDVWVRNDRLCIDGEVLLRNGYVRRQTDKLVLPEGARQQNFVSEHQTIPHTKRNDIYQTDAWAIYRQVIGTEQNQKQKKKVVLQTNDVTVHTPVVCKGGVTDDIAHNQQVEPTTHFSLVLGREFAVGISTKGTHKEQPGYGTGDYEKYTEKQQVRFPFCVYVGQQMYEENTWIDLPLDVESSSFYLPIGVAEGDYIIRYRTIAKNAGAVHGGADANGYLANLELSEYGAYDELTVTVVGRLYDLAVTDIIDYPRWKSVFYEADGTKKQFAFWVGKNNLEGAPSAARSSDGILPILAGDHPYNPTANAVGLGYQVRLQVKTIGDMQGAQAQLGFAPTYYYVSRDGTQRRRVHLYRKEDLSEVCEPLVLSAADRTFVPVYARNVTDAVRCAQSVQVWEGTYQLSPDVQLVDATVDLDSYIDAHGGRISANDAIFYKDGYLLVRFEICSYRSGTVHLSYTNTANSVCGYCNMWRTQGFSYTRTDARGAVFSFADGDCLLFDIRNNLHRDYESWGTH